MIDEVELTQRIIDLLFFFFVCAEDVAFQLRDVEDKPRICTLETPPKTTLRPSRIPVSTVILALLSTKYPPCLRPVHHLCFYVLFFASPILFNDTTM
jgi:hypothetical protein